MVESLITHHTDFNICALYINYTDEYVSLIPTRNEINKTIYHICACLFLFDVTANSKLAVMKSQDVVIRHNYIVHTRCVQNDLCHFLQLGQNIYICCYKLNQ